MKQFKLVQLTSSEQKLKNDNIVTIQPLTKQGIKDSKGNIVAYIPDFAPDGTGEALVAKLNKESKIQVPELIG